ncbi:MAG TPA: hypothetical protein DSN98_08960 [Thermoplasmata archaeon]|jgi:hypothetical protein|nr:MAG TPA: hypothetical protein DSN98_08960 [Thermoplasmata archaeon]
MQNVTDLEQQTERTVQDACEYAENIIDIIQEPLNVLNAKVTQDSLWMKEILRRNESGYNMLLQPWTR